VGDYIQCDTDAFEAFHTNHIDLSPECKLWCAVIERALRDWGALVQAQSHQVSLDNKKVNRGQLTAELHRFFQAEVAEPFNLLYVAQLMTDDWEKLVLGVRRIQQRLSH
jgi:hypothetical protein